jgi:hypothetical protein
MNQTHRIYLWENVNVILFGKDYGKKPLARPQSR